VLVMTLLVLVVAAVALSAVTAESHQRAMAARTAQDELQRRWAALSCERTLLPRTAEILSNPKPRARLVETLELGGQRLHLVFGDEQAKVNINLLAKSMDGAALRERLNHVAGPGAAIDLLPTINRTKEKSGKETASYSFASYGQVFGETQPGQLAGPITARLTCWGDGRLNTKAASPAALAAVAATVLDKDELLRFDHLQKKNPDATWRDLFRGANILPDKVKTMESHVTEESACKSLWVIPDDGRHYRFAVESAGEMSVFEW
jgi:hypothetical protein